MSEHRPIQLPARYKSQKRRRQPASDAQNAPPLPTSPDDVGLAKSKSRYHRKAIGLVDCPSAVGQRALTREAQSPLHDRVQDHPGAALRETDVVQTPLHRLRPADTDLDQGYLSDSGPPRVDAQHGYRRKDTAALACQRRSPGADAQAELNRPRVPLESPRHHILLPPERIERPPRPQVQPQPRQLRPTKSMSELPGRYDESRRKCFGFFKRKRGQAVPAQVSKAQISRPVMPVATSVEQSGGGIMPVTEAPKSAVNNAGGRQVLVECGRSRTIFPVTPSTTPVEIIRSAATCMSENINARSSVLLEHFGSVGVQRPLRQYEHIRDVMNSWDNDEQNCLLLVDPGTGSSEVELSLAGVPHKKIGQDSWLLAYSQKVGKWDNRMVILKQDGQLVCQRDYDKPESMTNICHLSDFDIYTPTLEKMKKKIKPPKKHCFAIKSQQKTIMFESTENFVHFFSTADRATADSFYRAVQGWRSWYLVNVMGEGKIMDAPAATTTDPASDASLRKHRAQDSIVSHYQLGSFKPLLDVKHLEQRSGDSGSRPPTSDCFVKSANQFDVNISPERRNNTNIRQYPPVSLKKSTQLADDEPLSNLNRRISADRRRSSSLDRTHQHPAAAPQRSTSDRTPIGTECEAGGSAAPRVQRGRGHGRNASIEIKRSGLSKEPSKLVVDRLVAPPRENNQNSHAFTGEGLLASRGRSAWDGWERGRGVTDGSYAGGKPMLDLSEGSQYTQGSLLNKVVNERGPDGSMIDRERRHEEMVKYGEGF